MRHLLLALMIALLPLRGWVGDVMAMELMATTLHHTWSAIDSVAPQEDPTREEAGFHARHGTMTHAECPGHVTMAEPDTQAGSQHHANATDCSMCAACQICHAIALTPGTWLIEATFLPASQPQASAHRFASAEHAPGFKPPIF